MSGFTYYDDTDPAYEPILIPVFFNGAGAFGSRWTTDVLVRNDNNVPLQTDIPANSTARIASAPATGFLFRPARTLAGAVSVFARIRETSHDPDDLGTQLPIAREGDFHRHRLTLSNVVVDRRFRTTIRAYAIDPVEHFDISLTGQYVAASKGPGDEPWLAVFDLSPALLAPGTYDVEIHAEPGDARIWAMASMTNLATQRVTIVAP